LPTDASSATGCTPDNINQFLYWNDIHPTAPVQALWAQGLREAVPEPSTWAMLLIGFVGLALLGIVAARGLARRREAIKFGPRKAAFGRPFSFRDFWIGRAAPGKGIGGAADPQPNTDVTVKICQMKFANIFLRKTEPMLYLYPWPD
jgi:hypothetical protein